MTRLQACARAVALLAIAALTGCADHSASPTPLHSQDFVSATPFDPAPAAAAAPVAPATQQVATASPTAPPATATAPADPRGDAPDLAAVSVPVTQPGAPSGQFLVCGGVVAEVNGTPIYADKVIALLAKPLQAKAKTLDPAAFREYALGQISNQVHELVSNELEYAAASRTIGDDDKKLADQITQEWRKQQIREAGGSIELARLRAQQNGLDFDQSVQDQYRTNVARIYYQRNLVPHIQVTADDMRRYYQRHLQDEFTVHDAARFRLIRIDVAPDGPQKALDRATALLTRAQHGEDFATLATLNNDDKRLAANAGFPSHDFFDRGSFAIDKVDDAVWKLQPGQLGDLVQTPDAFYLVKLEELHRGRVQGFNEEAVQNQIRDTLRAYQFRNLRDTVQLGLEKQAVIKSDESMLSIALDIAMQGYVRWRQVGN